MAEQDKIIKEELARLLAQETPILEGANANSLTMTMLFLSRTKDWNGEKAVLTVVLKQQTEAEIIKLLQSMRMRISRMRSKLNLLKKEYKHFTLISNVFI